MKKTMLTAATLDRFEKDYTTENYTPDEIGKIEFAAYVANMNACNHAEWTESDIFNDFLRVLAIDKITVMKKEKDPIENAKTALTARKDRSAWDKGVTVYALELLDSLQEIVKYGDFDLNNWTTPRALRSALLNGATNWSQYSWGGSALIYDNDIAERLCTPSELKKTRHGGRRPNNHEEWLDVQARALFQAANRLYKAGLATA